MARQVMLVCEDQVGAAILERLLQDKHPMIQPYATQVTRSNSQIRAQMEKYVKASRAGIPHIILTDLDNHRCAPSLIEQWKVPTIPGFLFFRVAAREAEAWILADKEALADFLDLPAAKLPSTPEAEADPKQTLMNLVRRSRVKGLRRDILPEEGSSASKGILYNEQWRAFILSRWDPQRAARRSASLRRAMMSIARL